MIKYYLLFVILGLVLLLANCRGMEEEIFINQIGSDVKAFGFSNTTYVFGEAFSFENVDTTGLQIELEGDKLKSVSIINGLKYELSNGIKIGSSRKQIIDILGKPSAEEMTLNKGSIQIGSIPMLIYDHVHVMLNEDLQASSITVHDD